MGHFASLCPGLLYGENGCTYLQVSLSELMPACPWDSARCMVVCEGQPWPSSQIPRHGSTTLSCGLRVLSSSIPSMRKVPCSGTNVPFTEVVAGQRLLFSEGGMWFEFESSLPKV